MGGVGAFFGFEGGLVTQMSGIGQGMVSWCTQNLSLCHTGFAGSFGIILFECFCLKIRLIWVFLAYLKQKS